jgi:hypothetical protein
MSKLILTEQSAAPTAPAASSGKWLVYATDGKLWAMDDTGDDYDLTAGGGAADTLQEAYDAGAAIELAAADEPVVLTAGAAASATTTFLSLRKSNTERLLEFIHSAGTVVSLQGASGETGADGTSIVLAGGDGSDSGDLNGGSCTLRPGAKHGGGDDGTILFEDPTASSSVAVYVDTTYPDPALRSVGTGTFGVVLGPVVELIDAYTASGGGIDTHSIPNNAGVCLYSATAAGTRRIYLPANPVPGQKVVVKDAEGTAATYNSTIYGYGGTTIDGSASGTLLNVDWQSYTFIFNTDWYII